MMIRQHYDSSSLEHKEMTVSAGARTALLAARRNTLRAATARGEGGGESVKSIIA